MWLIEQSIFNRMESAMNAGNIPSVEEQNAFAVEYSSYSGDLPRGMTVAGNHAAISVVGVLTNSPDLFARWYGGGNTVYSDIIAAAHTADNDTNITSVDFDVDSPGGMASADWLAVLDVIANMKTPTRSIVRGQASSAAYGIVSQTGEIEAVNALASVGSVGVVATFSNNDFYTEVTSTNAPNKRPDPKSAEGVAVIRSHLDQIEGVFISAIARGRGTDESNVIAKYGQGAVFLANKALEHGMIDSIASGTTQTADTPTSGAQPTGASKMDLATLKAEHPGVYAKAVAVGVEQGTATEKERVSAHLTLAKASGAMEIAVKAIEEGENLTPTAMAAHHAATLTALVKNGAIADDGDADKALGKIKGSNTPAPKNTEADFDAKVAKEIEASMGIEGGA